MDFELSAEQEALRESVRRFLAEAAPITPYVRERLAAPRDTSQAVWRRLAELGLTGILVPEAHGGSAGPGGTGMLEMGIVLEELGRAVHPGPFLASALGAVALIRAAASETEAAEWLPGLASGERIASVALYEEGRGGAWRHPSVTAKEAGGGWLLSGEKVSVLEAHEADLLLVVARAPAGLGVFAVEPGAAGVRLEARPRVDGTRRFAALALSDSPARRIGAGDATAAVAEAVDRTAIGWVADGLGAAGRAFELALDYAKVREQFGRPIGCFQAVQHLLADMLQDLELGRAGVYYALWAADAAEPAERHRAATLAQAFASDAFPRIGASAIQVFGGVGFTWEHDVHLFYKRLLSLQHAGGDAAEHLEELARLVLDAPGE